MRLRHRSPRGAEVTPGSGLLGVGWQALWRVATYVSPLLQGTAAATAAWVLALYVFDHQQPFFAPVAAVIALNTSLGQRGVNALRLLQGVVVGIVVGELTIAVLGGGYGSLALATFLAMAIARSIGGARIVIAQAAVSAILTVALADAQAGVQRLVDAVIGAAVALVFSQLLFAPEPVALVRRAEAAALKDMADGLQLTAQAVERDDDELAEQAMSRLRELSERLVELGRLRRASGRVVRHSLVWRTRMTPVVRENENAGHLDLIGSGCLVLTRVVMVVDPPERRRAGPSIRELADVLADLASGLGDRPTRQRAADRALAVARELLAGREPVHSQLAEAFIIVRMVAADVMVFAGVDPEQAPAAVRGVTDTLLVPAPPRPPRMPFRPSRRRRD